jgi:hypothetical protein
MLTPRYLIGFTGHRSGYDENLIRPVLTRILKNLKIRASAVGGQVELYASVAEGSDTLCAEIASELEMPVHLLLPLDESEFAKDFSSPTAWKRAQSLIEKASLRPGPNTVQRVGGEATRPEGYFNLGVQMLNAMDLLIAVWDGKPARGMGGSAEVIAQTSAIGTPVIHINSTNGTVIGTEALNACFMPDTIMTELNHIIQHSGASCASGEVNPNGLQTCLDKIAMAKAARFRPSLVRIILLYSLAALLAAVVTYQVDKEHWFYHNRWIFTATELVFVTSALWMTIRLHHKHSQASWVACRFACELLRSLRSSVTIIDPLHPLVARHEPRWRRFALSAGLFVQEHQVSHDLRVLRDEYLAARLSDQILHFQAKKPVAMYWWNFTRCIGTWSACLAPIFVVLSFLNKLSGSFNSGHGWHLEAHFQGWIMIVLLPIALPLLAGVAIVLSQTLDAGRRRISYPGIVARLSEIKRALPGLQTDSTIRTAIARSEEILLNELINWQYSVDTKPTH